MQQLIIGQRRCLVVGRNAEDVMTRVACFILAIASELFLAACSSSTDLPSRSIARFYGNFCGAGHPQLDATGRRALDELRQLKPIDDIDGACKQHDICYTAYAEHAAICDRALLDSLQAMRFSGSDELGCNRIARLIGSAFIALPVKAHPGNVLDTLVNSAFNTIGVFVAPVALIDITGKQPSTPCINVATITYENPPASEPVQLLNIEPHEFQALSHKQRCERLGNVAFNVTYSRIRGASLEDMEMLAATESGTGFSPETLYQIVRDVYAHPTLHSPAMATVHWLACMREGRPGAQATLRSTDEALEQIESCQYMSQTKPFQICIASALAGLH